MPSDMDPRSLLALSRQHARTGLAAEALQTAINALAIFERHGDTVGQADAAHLVVTAMLRLGQVEEAMKAAQEKLANVRMSGERSLEVLRRREAPLLLAAAECQLERDELGKAAASAGQALRFFQGVGESQGMAEATLVRARAHLLQDELKQAVKTAEAARSHFRTCGDRPGEAAALRVELEAHMEAANYSEAVKTAEAAQAIFSELDNTPCVAQMFQSMAQAQLKSKQPEEALTSARKSVHNFSEAGQRKHVAAAMMMAARAHLAQQEQNHATLMAKQALSILKNLGDKKAQADVESEISQMLMQTGELGEATKYAETAHATYKELQDGKGKAKLNEMLCTLELAPDIIELRQAKIRGIIRKLVRSVSTRDGPSFKQALHDLDRAEYRGMFETAEIKVALEPQLSADPQGTVRFVRANAGSWNGLADIEVPKSTGLKDWTLRFFDD